MYPIIFLDIDGVLNNYSYRTEFPNLICPYNIVNLNKIIAATKAKIVISSYWRETITTDFLKSFGFIGDVIGYTPRLSFHCEAFPTYSYSVPRGCEIKAWLELNKADLGVKMSKLKYVILDDDSDMLYWQRDKFLWVDPYNGITPSIAYKAIQILNN